MLKISKKDVLFCYHLMEKENVLIYFYFDVKNNLSNTNKKQCYSVFNCPYVYVFVFGHLPVNRSLCKYSKSKSNSNNTFHLMKHIYAYSISCRKKSNYFKNDI